MPIRAGAIGNLTQYHPFTGAGLAEHIEGIYDRKDKRDQQQWHQGQREKEFQQEQEQDDRSWRMDRAKFGLDQEKFAYDQQQKQRALKAQAYDELMDAYLTNDPEQIRAAAQKARLAGLDVPGLEESQGATPQGAPQAKGEAPPPEKTQTPVPVPAPQEKTLKGVTEGVAPKPGEDIGDGWEVVDTPPEAQQEPQPQGPAPWLTNELESRGDISYRRAQGNRVRGVIPTPQGPPEPQGAQTVPGGQPLERGPGTLPGAAPAQMVNAPLPGGVSAGQPTNAPLPGGVSSGQMVNAPIGGLPGGQPVPQPQGPPALQIVDRDTGEVIGQLNPEAAMGRAQARVARAMDSLVENQRNGEEQRAAAIAKDTALRLVGVQGYSVRDAIQAGQTRYDKELGRATAKSVARGGKPDVGEGGTSYERGGRSPEQVRTSKTVGDYVHLRIIQKAQQIYSTKELQAASRSASSIAAKMKDANPVSQRGAIRDVIMMTEGKRATDRDLDFALSGGGNLSRLHMELKGWIDGGAVPQNLREKFGAYANMLSALLKEQQAKAMKYAEEMIYDDPALEDFGLTPEDKAYWASQAKRGVAGQAIGLSPRGKAEKEEGEKAMRGGMSSADAEADDIMGELDAR